MRRVNNAFALPQGMHRALVQSAADANMNLLRIWYVAGRHARLAVLTRTGAFLQDATAVCAPWDMDALLPMRA